MAAAGADADANAGQGDVGDSVSHCPTKESDAGEPLPGGVNLPVTPIITLDGGTIVLVKRSYTSPKRRQVTLSVDDGSFDGSGTLGISGNAINFFDDPTAGNPVKDGANFRGGQLIGGVKIFAEGVNPSASMDDVKLTLTLTPGSKSVKPPATATMTAVRVTLDICKSRTAAGTDPDVLSQNDKVNVGRPLRVQKANTAHRAKMIVRKAEPAAFGGNLVVNPLGGKVDVFDDTAEVPSGQAALGRHTLANGSIDVTNGTTRWVEAKGSASTTLRDTGFQLGIDGVDDDGDRVAITAFTVDKIECQVKVTPCLRGGTPAGATQSANSTTDDRTFASFFAVVRDSGDLTLVATVSPPSLTVSWDKERASDDKGLAGLPTDSAGADDKHHTFKTDATGSFNLMAFVDANGSGKRGPENDGLTFNMVMVEIKVPAGAANNKILRNPSYHTVAIPGNLLVHTGTSNGHGPASGSVYTDAEYTKHLIGMKVTVVLTGGGDKQQRGTDRITLGYIQQTPSDSITGTYADGKTVKEKIFASPLPPDPVTGGTPTELAFPVRDHRGASGSGADTFINSSSDADSKALATGFQKIVRFVDSPAIVLPLTHPVSGSSLASMSGSNDFDDFLVAFSSDFDTNFAVVATSSWSTTYGSFTAAGGWKNTGAAVAPADAAMTVNSPVVPGETVHMERCPPGFVDNLRMDAR